MAKRHDTTTDSEPKLTADPLLLALGSEAANAAEAAYRGKVAEAREHLTVAAWLAEDASENLIQNSEMNR